VLARSPEATARAPSGTEGCASVLAGVFSTAMNALGFIILAVVLIVILVLVVVFVRRRRRGGGVIATRDKE
jgi:heme/copper-type cytochrome/quinol oxidase subunit 2